MKQSQGLVGTISIALVFTAGGLLGGARAAVGGPPSDARGPSAAPVRSEPVALAWADTTAVGVNAAFDQWFQELLVDDGPAIRPERASSFAGRSGSLASSGSMPVRTVAMANRSPVPEDEPPATKTPAHGDAPAAAPAHGAGHGAEAMDDGDDDELDEDADIDEAADEPSDRTDGMTAPITAPSGETTTERTPPATPTMTTTTTTDGPAPAMNDEPRPAHVESDSKEKAPTRTISWGDRGNSSDFTDFGSHVSPPVKHVTDMAPAPAAPVEAAGVAPAPSAEQASAAPAPAEPIRGPGEVETVRISETEVREMDFAEPVDRAEVGDPNIVDVRVISPTHCMLIGKAVGTTQLILTSSGHVRVLHVFVEPNLLLLRDLIHGVSPTADVTVRSVNNTMVVSGTVADSRTAGRIMELVNAYQGRDGINHLNVAGDQQTLLRVVVAEVNKRAMRELGINWAVGGSKLSRDFFFSNNIGQINPTVFSSSGLPDVRQGQMIYSVSPNANSGFTNMTFGFPRAELQFFINALRENALARTLAEPNLVAINGQTATFLAGGEVPIPVTQGGSTAGAITIEYKEFGVRLAFTPTIEGGQRIRLHVMSEISDAVPEDRVVSNLPVFTFTTRRVESTIECGNGQSFVIAGLLNEQVNGIASRLPGLGDLPVLGTLFSSVEFRKSETELIVLVTPQLVEPLDANQIVPPSAALQTDPNDFELFMLQKLEGARKENPPHMGAYQSQVPPAPKDRSPRTAGPSLQILGSGGFEPENE